MVLTAVLVIRGGGSAEAAPAESQTGTVTLTEFAIEGDLAFTGGAVTLTVDNAGSQLHNLTVEGGDATPDIAAGESATLELVDLSEGSYVVFCSIAGHREAGMEAVVSVSAGGEAGHEAEHGTDADWAAMDQIMVDSIAAFPVETEGKGNQPLEPQVLADGTKEFHLTAAVTPWEVSPGKVVDAWTYNGMVPAPAIRVEVGDKVRVVLDNQLPLGTDIHWHGVKVPNAMDGVAPITQPLVKPGETFTYEFEATEPAIAMYHAHAHGHLQVPNGLFGTFIIGDTPLPAGQTVSGVEIPGDIEIAHEIPMVLNDAGVIGLTLNAKSLPRHRALRRQSRGLGGGPLLQRGDAGPPDASAPIPPTGVRQGRNPARQSLLGGHDQHRARGAVLGPVPAVRSGDLGMALPHPQSRRKRPGHVRHGHRMDRRGVTATLSRCSNGSIPT